ncbi:hypothetical protein Tco_1145484 [Tanacetum coccineum]
MVVALTIAVMSLLDVLKHHISVFSTLARNQSLIRSLHLVKVDRGGGECDDYLSRKHFGFQEFLEKQKLSGPNSLFGTVNTFGTFNEDKEYYREHLFLPFAPVAQPGEQSPSGLALTLHGLKGPKGSCFVLMLLDHDLDIQGNLAYLGAIMDTGRFRINQKNKRTKLVEEVKGKGKEQEDGGLCHNNVSFAPKNLRLLHTKKDNPERTPSVTNGGESWAREKELSRVSHRVDEKEEAISGS